MKNYTFLTNQDYFKTFAHAARRARPGERVMIAAMGFDPSEPLIHETVEALKAAAKNGADVVLLIDAIVFMLGQNGRLGPLFYGSLQHARGHFKHIVQTLEEIQAAGGRFHITNMPAQRFAMPVAGRSHIKGAVVGDRIFIGGCNMERTRQIDAMVTWTDRRAADTLATWLTRIAEARRVRDAFGDVDTETAIDDNTSLILDAGVTRQSLIYEEALRLIDAAEKWLYVTCQYFPGGRTAQHLAMAQKRGVHVEIQYSHPRAHRKFASLQYAHQLVHRMHRLPRNFFAGRLDKTFPKLHAKVLISEKNAMIGSHNYVVQGVNLGTAELALRSSDPAFSEALRTFVADQLASTVKSPDATTERTAAT